jgi:hypothetical protein
MEAYRVRTTVVRAGEVVVRGLPLEKDQEVEVIVLTGDGQPDERELCMHAAENAPSMAFLHDGAEDIYEPSDLKERFE